MTNLERRMQHKQRQGFCTKIVNDTVWLTCCRWIWWADWWFGMEARWAHIWCKWWWAS